MNAAKNPARVGASSNGFICEREFPAVANPTMAPASAHTANIGTIVCEGLLKNKNAPRENAPASGHATALHTIGTATFKPRLAFGEVISHGQLHLPDSERLCHLFESEKSLSKNKTETGR